MNVRMQHNLHCSCFPHSPAAIAFLQCDFIVHNTNYYTLNHLTPVQGEIKRVGDLLHCRNAIAAGECGKHEQCKLCDT